MTTAQVLRRLTEDYARLKAQYDTAVAELQGVPYPTTIEEGAPFRTVNALADDLETLSGAIRYYQALEAPQQPQEARP